MPGFPAIWSTAWWRQVRAWIRTRRAALQGPNTKPDPEPTMPTPLEEFLRTVRKAPNLIAYVLVPAAMGNAFWALIQLLVPGEQLAWPYFRMALVVLVIAYLLMDFVDGCTGQYRVYEGKAPPGWIAIERFFETVALAFAIIALTEQGQTRWVAAGLAAFGALLCAGHVVRLFTEKPEGRERGSRTGLAGLCLVLAGVACAIYLNIPDGVAVEKDPLYGLPALTALLFVCLLAYAMNPWPHHGWTASEHLRATALQDGVLTFAYDNSRRSACTAVTVLAYDPTRRDEPSRRYVEVALENGAGTGTLNVTGWRRLVLSCEDSLDYVKELSALREELEAAGGPDE